MEDIEKNGVVEAPAEDPNANKKKRIRDMVIAIIIILLLLGLGIFFFARYMLSYEDPDIVIAKIINKAVDDLESSTDAIENSSDAYFYAKNRGYILDDLLLSKENRFIVWDSATGNYVLMEDNTIVYSPDEKNTVGTNLWKYVNEVPGSSVLSIFWCGTNKVTKDVVTGQDKDGKDIVVQNDFYYTQHIYAVSVSGGSQTYTCTEDGCGYTYTVKVEK